MKSMKQWRRLVGLGLLLVTTLGHAANRIVVEEEFGFSYFPGDSTILAQNGPAWTFGGGVFQAQYLGNALVVTALEDYVPGDAFGLGVFPCCTLGTPPDDFIAFVSLTQEFHTGEFVSTPIAAVPEASSLLFALGGLAFAGAVLRRKRLPRRS